MQIDGNTVYKDTKPVHPTDISVPCYASPDWTLPANATISDIAIYSSANAPYLAKEIACFSAIEFLTDYRFYAPKAGNVSSVELHYIIGGVTCNYLRDRTNWGCLDGITMEPTWFAVQMIQEYPGDNVSVNEETILPNTDTQWVSSISYTSSTSGRDCSIRYYNMDDNETNANSDVLTWNVSSNPIDLAVNDTFSLQYGEACANDSFWDNDGATCAEVYFEYEPFSLVLILLNLL